MTKPWELSPGGVDAPAQVAQEVWLPPAGAEADQALKADEPKRSGSLTRDELKQYLEFSRRNALARLDADNFEMEMRRDFAERRLKKLQHANG